MTSRPTLFSPVRRNASVISLKDPRSIPRWKDIPYMNGFYEHTAYAR